MEKNTCKHKHLNKLIFYCKINSMTSTNDSSRSFNKEAKEWKIINRRMY